MEDVPFDTTQHVYYSLCPHTIQSGTIDLTDCLIITDIGELPGPILRKPTVDTHKSLPKPGAGRKGYPGV